MLPLAQGIQAGTNLPTIAVGLLDDEQLLMNALEDDRCTLIALGRELLRNPNKLCDIAAHYDKMDLVTKAYERAYLEK